MGSVGAFVPVLASYIHNVLVIYIRYKVRQGKEDVWMKKGKKWASRLWASDPTMIEGGPDNAWTPVKKMVQKGGNDSNTSMQRVTHHLTMLEWLEGFYQGKEHYVF